MQHDNKVTTEMDMPEAEEMVLVRWRDSSADSHWVSKDSPATEPRQCESVGYVVEADSTKLVLAGSLTNDSDFYMGWVSIPTAAVIGWAQLYIYSEPKSVVQAAPDEKFSSGGFV